MLWYAVWFDYDTPAGGDTVFLRMFRDEREAIEHVHAVRRGCVRVLGYPEDDWTPWGWNSDGYDSVLEDMRAGVVFSIRVTEISS